MTETSSKGVLRSTTIMFLFVGLLGIWMGGCETQEQKVEKLIKRLGHKKVNVRVNVASALGWIGEGAKDAVPALILLLQDIRVDIRASAAKALVRIGTPEAIKAAEDTVSALIQALQDQGWVVRKNAAVVLKKIGTPEALKAVKEYQSQQ